MFKSRKFRKSLYRALEGAANSLIGVCIAIAVTGLGLPIWAAILAIGLIYAAKSTIEFARGSRNFVDMVEDAVSAIFGVCFFESKILIFLALMIGAIFAFNAFGNPL